jgi:RHS repeat-associated protein
MGKERSFSYDSLGNVISQVDPKGQETRFIYSPAGRVNSILYADGREVSYEYDTLGNRTKMTDWIGETSYKYDDFSRMKRIVTPDNRTLKYSYNNLDELSKITLSGDGIYGTLKWKYSYDNYGRLESIKDPQDNETSYSYDVAGRLVESVLPNAVKKVLSYDKNSNLLSMIYEDYRGREVDSFSYTYDAVGNRLAMEEPEGITRYSYDDKYQLTKAEKFERPRGWRLFDRLSQLLGKSKCPRAGVLQEKLDYLVNNLKKDYSIAYNYDAVGNRTQKLVDASSYLKELKSGSYDYFYDNDNRLIEEGYQKANSGWGNSWGSCFSWQGKGNKHGGAGHGKVHEEITNYIYDLNGNLLEQKQGRDISKFSYDASDNMIMADVPGKKPVAFTFNGDGQRIARFFRDKGHHHGWSRGRSDDDDSESAQWWRKTLKVKWKLDTSFFYSGPEILAEFDSKGKLDASYTTGPGIDNLISVTRHNGRAGRNRPVSYFYASDALGSVRQIMDDRGRGVNSYSYTPFGVAYNVKEKVEQPYRYTGRRWDPNVGKLWYRSRHYAPGVGRFSQADKWGHSILFPTIYKKYTYVFNNPLIYTDPLGLYTHIIVKGELTSPSNITSAYNRQYAIWEKEIREKDPEAKIVPIISNPTGLDLLLKIHSYSTKDEKDKIASLYTFGHGGVGHINLGKSQEQALSSTSFLKMEKYYNITSLSSSFTGSADIIFKHCSSRTFDENNPESISEQFEKFINTEKTKNIVTGYHGEIGVFWKYQYWSEETTIDKKHCD